MAVDRNTSRIHTLRIVIVASTFMLMPAQGLAEAADAAKTPGPDELLAAGAPDERPAKPVVDVTRLAAAKKNAAELFKSGREAWSKGQWGEALLQYEGSMRAYPSWSALTAMASCLVKLQRHDEALDAFEKALQDFSDKLPTKMRASALEQVDIIRKVTGSFMITGAPAGSLVFIDGRLRGDHPLNAPVPTLVGQHWIKVYKEGFVVYEKDVDIAKGGIATLDVTLAPLPNAGKLKVGEVGKRPMEVLIDGVPVGITPWEGPVSPGPHSVSLRPMTIRDKPQNATCDTEESADIPADAGDPTSHEMGTEPVTVNVKAGETTPIDLKAERLSAVVRIVPSPPDAAVYIDGVFVGRGPYLGRAKPGKHVVKTQSDGYVAIAQEIDAKDGSEVTPALSMKKDLNAPKWVRTGRFVVEVRGGVPLAGSLGGEVATSCNASCQQSLATGANVTLRVGYDAPNGLGGGLTFGYFQIGESHLGFDASLSINGTPQAGKANDSTLLQNFIAGVYGSYRLGSRFPLRLGIGAGVMYGRTEYIRDGTFAGNAIGPLRQTGYFPWVYVEPEARVGVRISEGWSAGIAISGLIILAPRIPVWTQDMKVNAHSDNPDQLGTFTQEPITSNVFFAMNQGLYVQYGF